VLGGFVQQQLLPLRTPEYHGVDELYVHDVWVPGKSERSLESAYALQMQLYFYLAARIEAVRVLPATLQVLGNGIFNTAEISSEVDASARTYRERVQLSLERPPSRKRVMTGNDRVELAWCMYRDPYDGLRSLSAFAHRLLQDTRVLLLGCWKQKAGVAARKLGAVPYEGARRCCRCAQSLRRPVVL
jgi:hypothetical protein